MNIFKVGEVVDMGIEKEKKRRDFYGRAAETFKGNKELSELFIKLRDWEESHIKKFTEIRSRVEDYTFETYPGELSEYMRSLVEDRLYKEVSPDSFKKNVTSPADAINYGIAFEKDAILFFTELLPYIGSKNIDAINTLIGEEKKHVIYLSELKKRSDDGR
jgi:rubrerythrin